MISKKSLISSYYKENEADQWRWRFRKFCCYSWHLFRKHLHDPVLYCGSFMSILAYADVMVQSSISLTTRKRTSDYWGVGHLWLISMLQKKTKNSHQLFVYIGASSLITEVFTFQLTCFWNFNFVGISRIIFMMLTHAFLRQRYMF